MDVAIVPVSRVFKTYQGQVRIAELNSKNPVKRVQGQRDRVSISKEARAALTSHPQLPELETRNVEAQFVQTQFARTEEVEAEKNEENAPEPSAV